jgi:hypothetical protein
MVTLAHQRKLRREDESFCENSAQFGTHRAQFRPEGDEIAQKEVSWAAKERPSR